MKKKTNTKLGAFWRGIAAINDNFELVGYIVIGFFVCSSLFAVLFFRFFLASRLDLDINGEEGGGGAPYVQSVGAGAGAGAGASASTGVAIPVAQDEYIKKRMMQLAYTAREPMTP